MSEQRLLFVICQQSPTSHSIWEWIFSIKSQKLNVFVNLVFIDYLHMGNVLGTTDKTEINGT